MSTTFKTDRDLLEGCIAQFEFLKRLNAASSYVNQRNADGTQRRISKKSAIDYECDMALTIIKAHIENNPTAEPNSSWQSKEFIPWDQ